MSTKPDQFDYVAVESVDERGEEPVYDLKDVEPSQKFLLHNGAIVHNCMDEFSEVYNKGDRVEDVDPGQESKIMDQYAQISRRMSSRFQEGEGPAGKLFLVSSKKEENRPLEQYIDDLKERDLDDQVMIINEPIWEVDVESYPNYPEDHKWVCMGSTRELPQVLYDEEDVELHENRGHEVLKIPDRRNIIREFERNPIRACRDFIGKDPQSERKQKLLPVKDRVDRQSMERLPNLFKPTITLGEEFKNHALDKFFDPRKALNPGRPRVFHGDLSQSQDSTGLAMAHIVDLDEFGREIPGRDYMVVFDFLLEIRPATSDRIPIPNIRRFVTKLVAHYGFDLRRITFDGYQSVSTLQEIRSAEDVDTDRVEVTELSVDRNKGPYLSLRDRINDGSTIYPVHQTAKQELKQLTDTGSKFDHPSGGSKDLSDCMAGCVWNLMEIDVGSTSTRHDVIEEMANRRRGQGDDQSIEEQLRMENVAESQGKDGSDWEDEQPEASKTVADQTADDIKQMLSEISRRRNHR